MHVCMHACMCMHMHTHYAFSSVSLFFTFYCGHCTAIKKQKTKTKTLHWAIYKWTDIYCSQVWRQEMTPGVGCSLLPRHCLLAVFSPGEQQQRTKIDGRSRKLSKSFLMRIPKVLPVDRLLSTFIMWFTFQYINLEAHKYSNHSSNPSTSNISWCSRPNLCLI